MDFVLYIAGLSPLSRRAVVDTRRLCETHLAGRYQLTIVDLSREPLQGVADEIIASPTLLKRSPLPARRFVGDMSRVAAILDGPGVSSGATAPSST